MSVSINLTPRPDKTSSRKKWLWLLLWPLLGGAALAWHLLVLSPEKRAAEDLQSLGELLRPAVRAEGLEQPRLDQTRRQLALRRPASPVGREMAAGALAFLEGDLKEADRNFAAAALAAPDSADLVSFRAATALRQGNTAQAGELYLMALTRRTQAGAGGAALSSDQLGLALSLFMLQKPGEARPLAEEAWRSRRRELGPGHPDTLSAANRLATILVALTEIDPADQLLKEAYQEALKSGQAEAGLEETRLLLSVIYNQEGRLDELHDFFSRQPPPVKTAEVEPEAPPVAEAPPAESPPALVTAETLAAWDQAAEALAGYDDALAADLWRHALETEMRQEGQDYHLSLPLRKKSLALVRAYINSGQHQLAAEELALLADENGGEGGFEEVLFDLAGDNLTAAKRWAEAEKHWQSAVDQVDARVTARIKAKKAPETAEAERSLRLHLKLAENYLEQGRVPQEAEIELKAALGRLTRPYADTYPETARVCLSLARLLWTMGHTRESADYYKRAQSVAAALLKKTEDEPTRALLTETARLAEAESAALAAKKPAPDFRGAKGSQPGELPPPDQIRQALVALSALGRLEEFPARLAPVLAEAARKFGPASQNYMRYYSLKLKGLEEAGLVEELTAELEAQAENPPGRSEAEKALNRGSALIYAARVNEKAGRFEAAAALYRQALAALSGRQEDAIAARRQMVEENLKRLGRE